MGLFFFRWIMFGFIFGGDAVSEKIRRMYNDATQ